MTRITIIGAGFAGLSAIRAIRKRDTQVDITLIAPRAELHYLPGIIWIPSGVRQRADLVVPLDNFLAAHARGVSRHRGHRSARGRPHRRDRTGRRRQRRPDRRVGRTVPEEAAGHRALHHAVRGDRRRRRDSRPSAVAAGWHRRRGLCRQSERTQRDARRSDVRVPVRHRPAVAPRRPPRPLRAGVLQSRRRARQPARTEGRRAPAGRNGAARHPYASRVTSCSDSRPARSSPRAANSRPT